MRKHLAVFAALFLSLAAPALAQDAAPAAAPVPASDKKPGLNDDMGDMGAGPGTALPPPGMEGGKVARPKPGEADDVAPSQVFGNVPPAQTDPTTPQGVLPPSVDANITPVAPADADAPPVITPGAADVQPPLPPANATPTTAVPPPIAPAAD